MSSDIVENFLPDFPKKSFQIPLQNGLKPEKWISGKGSHPLEVRICKSPTRPKISSLKAAQKKIKNGRAAPVLLTVVHGGQASFCGLSGDHPSVYREIPLPLAEKFCRTALKQANRHKVHQFCSHFLPSIETGLFGLNNRGMFSSYHLLDGVKKSPYWKKAEELSAEEGTFDFEREELLEKLGFHLSPLDNLTYILKSRDKKRALAILLESSENHESRESRFNHQSPVRYALDRADEENMPYVLMIQDNHIRLYKAGKEEGLSPNSQTETSIECQLSLLSKEHLGYLWLIFSAEALSEGGSFEKIREESKRFSADVAENLKERIYDEIVPQIARGVFHAKDLKKSSSEKDLRQIYEMALTILFRLLFIVHAEDNDLLPYNTNSAYKKRSLKQKALELSKLFSKGGQRDEEGESHYKETANLWRAIDKGNPEWGIMAYNGGLFSSEKSISKTGFEISKLSISNRFFASALKSLLLMDTEDQGFRLRGLAPVDFRFIGPKEFGTVYEGLLESSLSIAQQDLVLDKDKIYVPVKKPKLSSKRSSKKIANIKVDVKKGELYLHNQSGARKASGSYYTKSFAVEHILDHSLEPALHKHFERLNKLSDDKEREKEFFNFKVADISMGSGHFLVAAVDRIEKGMADYLDNRPLKAVQSILKKLKTSADKNLQKLSSSNNYFPVENRKLLARHIAKHCIYGVDNNELAVQLARLSLWTHTFIPGLPLSYFNHNLICGNSLLGIGTIEEFQSEFKDKTDEQNLSFDLIGREELLAQAKKPLEEMKILSDSNLKEVARSRKVQQALESSLKDTKALFDVMIYHRIHNKRDINKIEGLILAWKKNPSSIHRSKELKLAQSELKGLQSLHFPIAFPEVFLRERPGFDCIIGNPPWEKVKLEEHAFYARHFPGLRGLSQREREVKYKKTRGKYPHLVKEYKTELSNVTKLKNILRQTSFSQTGSGDSDLYKFFSWRFWHLICAEGGFLGVVLPGNVFSSKGSELFRKEIFKKATVNIMMLLNNKKWIFAEVHAQYSIALLSSRKQLKNTATPLKLFPNNGLNKRNSSNINLKSHATLSRIQKTSDKNISKHPSDLTKFKNHFHFEKAKFFQKPTNQIKEKTKQNTTSSTSKTIHIQGPFRSLEEFKAGRHTKPLSIAKKEVFSWTNSASLPSLPNKNSLDVFLQMRKAPRLDLNDGKSWRVRPDTELHTTGSKPLMDLKSSECPRGFWPVWTGRSFNIWIPDTGKYYAYADPKKVIPWLYKKRLNGHKNLKSAHSEFSANDIRDQKTLPCFKPRIAFHDVTNSIDYRTVKACLLPPEMFLVETAPYLLFPRGDEKDEAFLLGVLSSIPLDWYARRFVSTHLKFFLLNTFPIPKPNRSHPLWKKVVAIAGRLAAPDKRFASWAKAVGRGEYGPLNEAKKHAMICELDALVAHLYGLSQKQLIHIFETFHKTWDYKARLKAVLKAYHF